MSLWRSKRLRAWLSPARIVLARAPAWGRSTSLVPICDMPIDEPHARGGFAAMLEALQSQLAQVKGSSGIDIALSDHFVRYVPLSWRSGLNATDWNAYARHEFERVYGRASGSRLLRIAPAPRGAARVAAAVDICLVDALRDAARSCGARLGTVEPNLCRIVNRFCRRMGSDGHLVASELGRLTRLTLLRGAWSDVQSIRCEGEIGKATARMLAELRCGPGDAPDRMSVWFFGRPDALDTQTLRDVEPITILPTPPALPDGCAAAGLI